MKWARQKNAARARGSGMAREITIPLPVKGLLYEANTSEVSGIYAGELLNWRSTGTSLRFRSQYGLASGGATALQRIPYEFRGRQEYIEAHADRIEAGDATMSRAFTAPFDHAFISSNLVIVDGSGAPVRFDGESLLESEFSTLTSTSQDQFDGIEAHNDRLYLWRQGDDLDFYYGDVGGVTGALDRFPLGRLGNITGEILCIKSLTVDAGHGMNDVLAIFTTTGQIVAYEGLDPGDAQDWRLLTRLTAAPPVSKNAFIAVGSDLWMLTASGVVSVTQTLRESSLALVQSISQPVREQLVAQVAEGGDWSMHLSADAGMVIVNRVRDGAASQFIYRTESRAWDTADYPAAAWHNLGLKTQFTTLDGQLATLGDDGGFQITARWASGWFRLPRAGGITYIKPTIIAAGPVEVKVTLLSDHDETGADVTEAEQTVTVSPDNAADPGGRVALDDIIAVDAVGEVFQIVMEVTAQWAELVNMKAAVQ